MGRYNCQSENFEFYSSNKNKKLHPMARNNTCRFGRHRPLSRRLDRCDRVIQKESGDPNGGNMCSFSWATGTSRVRHNADYVPCAQIRFDLQTGSTSESRQPHHRLQWRIRDKSLYCPRNIYKVSHQLVFPNQ